MDFKPIDISEKALKEIKDIMAHKNIPADYGLRVGVRGGGACGAGGMNYMLGFDKVKEDDIAYQVDEIPVYVEKKQAMYLAGLVVDFYEGADARGFTFVNPDMEKAEEN